MPQTAPPRPKHAGCSKDACRTCPLPWKMPPHASPPSAPRPHVSCGWEPSPCVALAGGSGEKGLGFGDIGLGRGCRSLLSGDSQRCEGPWHGTAPSTPSPCPPPRRRLQSREWQRDGEDGRADPGEDLQLLRNRDEQPVSVLPPGSSGWDGPVAVSRCRKGRCPRSQSRHRWLAPHMPAGISRQRPRLTPVVVGWGTGTGDPWRWALPSTRRAVKTHRRGYETPATYFTLPAFVLNSQIWPLSSFCPSRQINWSRS